MFKTKFLHMQMKVFGLLYYIFHAYVSIQNSKWFSVKPKIFQLK